MKQPEDELDELYGTWPECECLGCDIWGPVNDLGLCDTCNAKLDRDLIRQRAWEYSMTAAFVPAEHREKLRQQVIDQHGEACELITSPENQRKRSSSK